MTVDWNSLYSTVLHLGAKVYTLTDTYTDLLYDQSVYTTCPLLLVKFFRNTEIGKNKSDFA